MFTGLTALVEMGNNYQVIVYIAAILVYSKVKARKFRQTWYENNLNIISSSLHLKS